MDRNVSTSRARLLLMVTFKLPRTATQLTRATATTIVAMLRLYQAVSRNRIVPAAIMCLPSMYPTPRSVWIRRAQPGKSTFVRRNRMNTSRLLVPT